MYPIGLPRRDSFQAHAVPDRDIIVNNETEAIRIEIGLVNYLSKGILGGSVLVYEDAVHDSRPIYFVSLLIGADMIPLRTLKCRQIF